MDTTDKNSLFSPLAELLANFQADDLQVRKALQTPRARYVRDKTLMHLQTCKRQYTNWKERLEKGGALVQERLNSLSVDKRKPFLQDWKAMLEGNENPTEGLLSWLYDLAYTYYEQRDWLESSCIFQFLVSLSPFVSDYWTGLGFAQKKQDLEKDAISSFSFAVCIDPRNAIARYQLAQLFARQGLWSDALIEIDALSEFVKDPKLLAEVQSLETFILAKQRGSR